MRNKKIIIITPWCEILLLFFCYYFLKKYEKSLYPFNIINKLNILFSINIVVVDVTNGVVDVDVIIGIVEDTKVVGIVVVVVTGVVEVVVVTDDDVDVG